MSSMPAPLAHPPFGGKDTNGNRTMPASLKLAGQQQRLLRASQVIGRSGGDRAVSLTAAAENCRESARRAELRERLNKPGPTKRFSAKGLDPLGPMKRWETSLAQLKGLKTSASAPLLAPESDDTMKPENFTMSKTCQVESKVPMLAAIPAAASKIPDPSQGPNPFPIPKYRYFAEPWVARSPNLVDLEGNSGLPKAYLSGRREDRSAERSDKLPRMSSDQFVKFASEGPPKYHYFSEASLVSSPNFEMHADGGWGGICEARRTWSGLGKVL